MTKLLCMRTLTYLLLASALSIGTSLPTPAFAAGLNDSIDSLPATEQMDLRQGKPVVTGEDGNYTASVLLNATPLEVWSVLTDYNNYSHFLPDVTGSKILESMGNQRIFDEVDQYHVFLFTKTARTRLLISETPQSGFSFQMVEGALQRLQGNWSIQPLSATPGSRATQVLLTERIQAQPAAVTPKGLFYNIFRHHLEARLKAICAEVIQRSS